MKLADFLQSLKEFTLDVIGTIIPGVVLLIGLALATGRLENLGEVLVSSPDVNGALLIVVAYILGNAIAELGNRSTKARTVRMRSGLLDATTVAAFRQALRDPYPIPPEDKPDDRSKVFGALRNEAMSMVGEDKATVYRFMFIALFHVGTATSLLLSVIAYWLLIPGRAAEADIVETLVATALVVGVAGLLYARWDDFYSRAMRVPFSMALAKLKEKTREGGGRASKSPVGPGPLRVYLAGGFHSGWQERVREVLGEAAELVDPRSHGLLDEDAYTTWDLLAVERADVVFAYAEKTNPGLYALSLEIGYARALGRRIIFVDERSADDEAMKRHFTMLRTSADVSFDNFEDGVVYLGQLAEMAAGTPNKS